MKKRISVILCLICAIAIGVTAFSVTSMASGATISISSDQQKVKKEEEFTVSVTVSSNVSMQNIDTMLRYDADVIEYLSCESMAVAGASGMIHIMEEFIDPMSTVTYELKFKALEVGSSDLSVSDTYISEAETFNVVSVTSDSTNVEVVTNRQESSESRLSELLIAPGEMNEVFDPDTYTYTATVFADDETAAISAIPMDENAVVTMEKADVLNYGDNTVTITVTAPSGNTSVYTVNIYRDFANESETDAEDETAVDESEAVSEEDESVLGESEAALNENETALNETAVSESEYTSGEGKAASGESEDGQSEANSSETVFAETEASNGQ